MKGNKKLRTYFLFVHYGMKDNFFDEKKKLENDLKYLCRILEPTDTWKGYAFVFLDHGFRELIRHTITPSDVLDLAKRFTNFLNSIKVPDKIKLVTVFELNTFIKQLEKDLPAKVKKKLSRFIVSSIEKSYYDGPKIVEAILRIANIGRNTPIFRFDDDVLFYGSRCKMTKRESDKQADNTRRQIMKLCQHYDNLCKDPKINYFIFSGSYCSPKFIKTAESDKNQSKNSDIHEFLNGFATRVVQLAETEAAFKKLPDINKINKNNPEDELRKIEVKISTKKAASFLKDLSSVGANPFRQVISGAGFCLSDGAILDLPPYSNMHQNVMWIDDHLKYALHHELRHFGFIRGTQQVARIKDIYFKQSRHLPDKKITLFDVRWHVRDYLPRLVLGCIADKWLRENEGLKQSFCNLSGKQVVDLFKNVPGTYTKYFIDNVGINSTSHTDFKKKLWELAYARLKEIIDLFGDNKYSETFLQLFILGPSQNTLHGKVWEELGFFTEFAPEGLNEAFKNYLLHIIKTSVIPKSIQVI